MITYLKNLFFDKTTIYSFGVLILPVNHPQSQFNFRFEKWCRFQAAIYDMLYIRNVLLLYNRFILIHKNHLTNSCRGI